MISEWDSEIREFSDNYDLPYGLINAMVQVESGGDADAWNPEPHYRWFWDVHKQAPFRALRSGEVEAKYPPSDFPCLKGDRDQEWWAQQASWGLLQVMGAVARERGCRAPYLTALLRPRVGLEYGCAHLAHYKKRFIDSDGWPGVIAAYNQGGVYRDSEGAFRNAGYVAKVRALWA